jgi:uncharacterized RDD family membrane protein YckC
MRKTEFYYLLSVLTVVSVLLILGIGVHGNSDFLGELVLVLLSLIVLTLAAFSKRVFLWIGIVVFSFLGLLSLMALLENDSYLYVIISVGYLSIAWRLVCRISVKPTHETQQAENEIDLPPQTFISNHNRFEYPLLLRRVQALFIDSMLLLFIMVMIMISTEGLSNAIAIRIASGVILSNLYEPFFTAYGNTLGQWIMSIRVRNVSDPSQRLTLFQSYKRFIVKGLLGWLSFVTIHFNREHRAIHDFAGSSVMIRLRLENL